jgi:hypothetical protein
MSCNIKISVPIPDHVEQQGQYVAQALRELVPFIERQVPLTEGRTVSYLDHTTIKTTWVCEDEEGPPVEPAPERRRRK